MQTNMAMNADYEGDLGTHEADGYGGELEFDAGSNGNSSNYSPRQSCKIGLKIVFCCGILTDHKKCFSQFPTTQFYFTTLHQE